MSKKFYLHYSKKSKSGQIRQTVESIQNSLIAIRRYALKKFPSSEWIRIEDSKGKYLGSIWNIPKKEWNHMAFKNEPYSPLWVVEDFKYYTTAKMYPLFDSGRIGKEL